MQKQRALLFFVAALLWLSIPLIADAQGLVPCGVWEGPIPEQNTPAYSEYIRTTTGCDLCSLGQLMQNIINFLIGLSVSVAAAMFAYAGFLYVTGGSNPTQISKAHKIFKSVLIGFLIAISAYLVVQTLLSVVFDQDFWIGGSWNELQCSREERLRNASLSDLLGEVIPTTPLPIKAISAPSGSSPGSVIQVTCPNGYKYNQMQQVCVNSSCQFQEACDQVEPTIVSTTAGLTGPLTTDPNARIFSVAQLEAKIQGTNQYAAQLQTICRQQGYSDCEMAQAVMAIESNGNAGAVSPARCVGLMQVCPDTARGLDSSLAGLSNSEITARLKDPVYNMTLGVKYLTQMEGQFGRSTNTIAAYNGGPRANNRSFDCPGQTWWQCTANSGYAETRSYVPNVANARSIILQ
ncbi:hypothetical protein A3F55_02455 [Candidatus Adlerbacteria bacterium RIFCSPHIGHO2_12_FULL_53_18]|uniref:Transglycosylase SLT domain-containing protein n=1 Tax=Candidatus Adlerbacteria bacterium RIFCSPHIGHO2_12_FULL_53_18 TaxID=1797242 RepID=A0A1F4XUI2_9BACT|nr:MAG: hypothetical protein A3F55_02455 [Candidatus Adlerbacteria bacterium RIFCSPHIGHO2_12_FULL_53_18]